MALKCGVHEASWAAAHFATIEDASIAFERYELHFLSCRLLTFSAPNYMACTHHVSFRYIFLLKQVLVEHVWRCRLQFLFLQTQDVPFLMPLLVHPPHQTSYPWGPNFYPPGSIVNSGSCHFMQPNSLEFPPAQEWRTLDLMVAEWKHAMRELHQRELEEVIRAFVDVRHLQLHDVMYLGGWLA